MKKETESSSQLFYPHAMIYLDEWNAKILHEITRFYNYCELISDDDPYIAEIKKEKELGFKCDDCCDEINTYKWGCGQYHNFNFCDKCFQISLNQNHERFSSQRDKMKAKGHEESHFF